MTKIFLLTIFSFMVLSHAASAQEITHSRERLGYLFSITCNNIDSHELLKKYVITRYPQLRNIIVSLLDVTQSEREKLLQRDVIKSFSFSDVEQVGVLPIVEGECPASRKITAQLRVRTTVPPGPGLFILNSQSGGNLGRYDPKLIHWRIIPTPGWLDPDVRHNNNGYSAPIKLSLIPDLENTASVTMKVYEDIAVFPVADLSKPYDQFIADNQEYEQVSRFVWGVYHALIEDTYLAMQKMPREDDLRNPTAFVQFTRHFYSSPNQVIKVIQRSSHKVGNNPPISYSPDELSMTLNGAGSIEFNVSDQRAVVMTLSDVHLKMCNYLVKTVAQWNDKSGPYANFDSSFICASSGSTISWRYLYTD